MAFTKLSLFAFLACGVTLQIAIANAYVYDPSLTLSQAQALQDAVTINQATQLQQAALNQAAYNQAAINQAGPFDNPLYDYKNILSYPPYSLYCDCECSAYINDQVVIDELIRIADKYNQRVCDVQQWYLIIDEVMPTLPNHPQRLSMVESLASSLYNEQARRQLAYLPEYPGFCSNIYPEVLPDLAKRSPDSLDYATYPTPSTPSTISPLAYYYNLMYLMEKTMPQLSPQLQQDIKDSVYLNSDIQQLGQAQELIKRLNSNMKVAISEMYDFTPTFY